MNIDKFISYADYIMNNEIPPTLLRDLNMGIVVLPEEKEEGDFNIMGEYINDEMGSYITLYYGSFALQLDDEPLEVWKQEIRETIKHELTHHVESLAGDEQLALKEEREMEEQQTTHPFTDSIIRAITVFWNFIKRQK